MAGGRAQRFVDVYGGVAELEAMAEMELRSESGYLGEEDLRVLRAVLRRPRVAGRLVNLNLG